MSMAAMESPANKTFSIAEESSPQISSIFASVTEAPLSADLYRRIFVSLDLPDDCGPVIGITSAIAGEGRTTVGLGLAHTLAADLDTMVLLVDADLYRPSLHSHLDIPTDPGLAGVLRGEASLEGALHQVSERLFVVPSGTPGNESSRLLRQLSDSDLFARVRVQGGVTILDLPPILNNSYSSFAASAVDALVLVIRAGATPAEIVGQALAQAKVAPQGAVLIGQQPARPPRLWKRR